MEYVLVVDDDEDFASDFAEIIASECPVKTGHVQTGAAALGILEKRDVALVFLDLVLNEKGDKEESLKLLEQIRVQYPTTQVVIVTAHSQISHVVKTIKLGAHDFMPKPLKDHRSRLPLIVRNVIDLRSALHSQKINEFQLVGESQPIIELHRQIRDATQSGVEVLIIGERGTGKELVSRSIHNQGPHASEPFEPVLCPLYPQELIASKLFGHEKGTFTSAEQQTGAFERAGRGTLLLDEISEMDPKVQVSLLRVLETGEFQRLGGKKHLRKECQVLAATNCSLTELRSSGFMRNDLFDRFVLVINVPPLRDRKEDIPLLVSHFLKIHSRTEGIGMPSIQPSAIDRLLDYDYPGNVRELENLIRRIMMQTNRSVIDADAVSANWFPTEESPNSNPMTLKEQCKRAERKTILKALLVCGHNYTKAAERLGISRQHLHRLLKEHNLDK